MRTSHAPRLALRLQPPRLDRIVRGRAWIPVLAAMLVAIVGLRVAVLKLGASVGSQIQQATLLESSNTTLRTQVSALSDNQRIEKLAEAYGMHLPNPLDVHFVPADAGRHLQAAIRNISAPANSSFLTGVASEQQSDQASTQATLNAVGATSNSSGAGGTTSTATPSTATTGGGVGGSTTPGTTGSTAATGATGSASIASGSVTAGQTSAGSSSSSTSTGATAGSGGTASTYSAGSSATVSGSTGLNTGATNMAASSATSQTTGSTSGSGGTGLAG